jgi:NAD(P)-dependent dehydrogenase (short-subunit alcohol dehydrogenase family)
MAEKWTARDIPDQRGRVAVVTGANSGLGLVAARELARAGAHVVLACRSVERGERAMDEIRGATPDAELELARLDLGALASVRDFAERFAAEHEGLDILVNNAGIMATPRRTTADGFESQLGTNHLGHFALTGLLMARLLARPQARVVTVSSVAHRMGRISFDNLQGQRRYWRWSAYGQSKLANLLFAFELQRRASAAGLELRSMAAHPGYSATNLQSAGPQGLDRWVSELGNLVYAQSAERGALNLLYAATVADLPGGSFIGPDGLFEGRGYPRVVQASRHAYDESTAQRLWQVSEQLTGVSFQLDSAPAAAP